LFAPSLTPKPIPYLANSTDHMQNDVFYSIGKIIERDSKSTTYKFALLRGVIDMIQDNSPYTTVKEDRVSFPMGLLIEKWLLYYTLSWNPIP
jgi:hypothetical protein